MNRSQMRQRNSRPSLMRARPTTKVTKLAGKMPTAKSAPTGLARTATAARKSVTRSRKRGLRTTWSAKRTTWSGKAFGPFGKASRKPARKTLIAACAGTVVVAACVAALPVTRRTWRQLVAKRPARQRNRQLTPAALDQLTGLVTRSAGERMLGEALERGKARGRRVALLYVDLDDFKICTDTYGEAAGDHVLQVTAARMQAQLRSGDTVCRLGGDDFMIIMESAGPDHTVGRIAERISDAIAQPITYEGETILVSASVGVAVAVNGEAEANELIAHGDAAVDRARAAGRHVVQY